MLRTLKGSVRVGVRYFSSAEVLLSAKSVRKQEAVHLKNYNKYMQRMKEEKKPRVDPVLGSPNNSMFRRLDAESTEDDALGLGYNMEEVQKLIFGAQQAELAAIKDSDMSITAQFLKERQAKQVEAVMRILNIKNRSVKEKTDIKMKIAINEFQRREGDIGSSEVQAAIFTVKIREFYRHLQQNRKDFQNFRKLRILVHKRQKVLQYLKRSNVERYYWTINKLGLTDDAVHKEFNVDKQYMQDYKMYGDREFVRISIKQKNLMKIRNRKEKTAVKMMKLKREAKREEAEAAIAEEARIARAEEKAERTAAKAKKQAEREQQKQATQQGNNQA